MEQGLYQKKEAFTKVYSLTGGELLSRLMPGRIALILLYDICTDFGASPSISYRDGEKNVTVLFHNVSFSAFDFCQNYGELIACLSESWPLTVYGTAETMETCELLCHKEEKQIKAEQRTVSGKKQDILQDMCLRMECSSKEDAQAMAELLASMDPGDDALAVSKRYEMFCRTQELSMKSEGSHYCYVRLDEAADSGSFVRSLSMEQKAELWRVFLSYGVCPMEFEWLYQLYKEKLPVNLLEWELALRQELEAQDFKVVHEEAYFMVKDAEGAERRFDFTSGSSAEKIFLKVLFPLGGH